jgi:hypothetical protein
MFYSKWALGVETILMLVRIQRHTIITACQTMPTGSTKFLIMFDKISETILAIYDNLKDDSNAQQIIDNVDTADSDYHLKKYILEALEYMRNNGNGTLAKEIENKLGGWLK